MRSIGLPLLSIALGVSLFAAGASAAGLRVLASDASRLDVEWTRGDVTWEAVPGESGRTFRRPRIAAGSYLAGPGEPDVPSVVRMIGIPPEGTPRVRVVSVEPVVESAAGLAPGPEPYVETPPDAAPRGAERRVELLDRPGARPAAWAEIQGITWVRGQRLARLVLHPFRYDAAARELTTADRLVVRVEFGDAGLARTAARRDQADWEALLDDTVPNAATARRWRNAPAPRGTGDSFASSSAWLRVPVNRTGVYRLDYFTFANAGVDPAGIDPRTVRVFSGTNLPLREPYDTPPPSFMTENAILYLDDDPAPPDGVFDVDDRFLLYALAPNGWANEYDPARSRTEYVENAYTDSTYYWITWGGSFSGPPQRIDDSTRIVAPGGVPADSIMLSMPHRVHFEENNVEDFRYPAEDGWQWEDLHGRGENRLYQLSLDRVAGVGDGAIRARVLSHEPNPSASSNNGRQVELKVAGQIVADSIWTHSGGRALVDLIGCFQGGLFDGANSIRVNAREDLVPNSLDRVYTAWFDIEHNRVLRAKAGAYLKFYSDPAPPAEVDSSCSMAQRYGKTAYKLQGFQTSRPNSEIFLFDVSDQHRPVRLQQFVTETAGTNVWNVVFADTVGQSSTRWYVATTMAGVLPLAAPEIVTPSGLRSVANGAEYVVIYHPDFEEGAERLARLRATLPGNKLSMAVNVEDVYNEFSWGMTDPVAIRDFLAWSTAFWNGAGGAPLYAVLVGDASYDTKHYLPGSPTNYLGSWLGRYKSEPTVQYVTSSNLNFYTTDDFFGYVDTTDYDPGVQPGLDIAIGRYPVPSPEEMELELDKLESYTAYESPGQWQNRIVLTADDERTLVDAVRETYHTEQVETLARERVPPAMDKVRIYLTEYPRNEFGKKPEAQEAFIDEVTRGALMVTYTGHGDQNTMAQEEVFVSQKIPELLNEARYCVFSTFSCQVSRFDLLSGSSIAELLLAHPDGGAVTTFSSGGLVFPAQSAELNQQWLGVMFGTPYPVHTYARSLHPIGLSAIWAKSVVGASSYTTRINNEKYVLLGDPALTLRYGRNPIEFETATVDSPQVVDGLLRVVRGTVRDEYGAVQDGTGGTVPFNGTAYVHVTEQADTTGYFYTLPSGAENRIPYTIDGATTYRGEIPVTNGRFEARFHLSEAVKSGNRARISVFALEEGVGRDASGATDTLYIAPTISASQVDDGQGPRITISFEGYDNFVNGDFLFTDRPVLVIDLEDESGINLLPYPEFALLAAEVDEREQVALADDYAYLDGSFTHGRVRRILPLSPGEHTLQVKAFDNVGNRGSAEVEFSIVLPSASFDIDDAHTAVYPNPFVNATTFLFQLTHPAEVVLKVFTITGRRIYETGPFTGVQGSNRVRWDGRDDNGRILANGTYLYKLEASTTNAEGQVESDEFVGHVVKMR
jgi:hypothetical protein